MKRLFLALLSASFCASSAFAIVGGPWDSNIPGNPTPVNPSDINGTYTATIKGKNLAGVIRFSSASIGTFSLTASGSTAIISEMNVTGSGTFFFEGTSGAASVDTVIDLGGRKIAGVINGASTSLLPVILVRPPTATTPLTEWTVLNNIYFNGAFSARFSNNWATNSFSGKGTVAASKFDFAGFNTDLAANPATADPNNHLVVVPVPIKIAGVKASDTIDTIHSPSFTISLPIVTQILP